MSLLHNIKIKPIGNYPTSAEVLIDDKSIHCTGYEISHSLDGLPKVELQVCCKPTYDHDVILRIGNKEEIARIMDKKEFEEFCKIWKEVHNE